MLMAIHTLKLVRSGETFKDSKGAHGEWGVLWVDSHQFDALERTDHYVRLKKGESYEVKCYKSKHLGQTLSPIHNIKNQMGEIARIRIHAANYPHQLAGCIAPGQRNSKANKLEASRATLDYIFELLEKWEDGKSVGTISVS
jgi:hypothetical protein